MNKDIVDGASEERGKSNKRRMEVLDNFFGLYMLYGIWYIFSGRWTSFSSLVINLLMLFVVVSGYRHFSRKWSGSN